MTDKSDRSTPESRGYERDEAGFLVVYILLTWGDSSTDLHRAIGPFPSKDKAIMAGKLMAEMIEDLNFKVLRVAQPAIAMQVAMSLMVQKMDEEMDEDQTPPNLSNN